MIFPTMSPDGERLDGGPTASRINRGRKAANDGNCIDALKLLLPVVGALAFGPDASISAAMCARRGGWLEDAVWLGLYAMELDVFNVKVANLLAVDLDVWGDREQAEDLLDRMDGLSPASQPTLPARAILALRDADLDELDILLDEARRHGGLNDDLRRVAARSWLDLDDPVAADALLSDATRSGLPGAEVMLRAEASRRQGDVAQANEQLNTAGLVEVDPAEIAAMRARALIDDGHIAEAEMQLAPFGVSTDEEVIASQWYLARATSRPEDMAVLARAYEAAKGSPLRLLEQLIPIPDRAPHAPAVVGGGD